LARPLGRRGGLLACLRLVALEPVQDVREVELGGAAAQDARLRPDERDLLDPDRAEQEGQIADADVQALKLEGALVHALLEKPDTLQGDVTGEEVQVDVVDSEDTSGKLWDLIDRDPAYDLRKDREAHRDDHHQPREDRDQDLADAAGQPKHQTSTSTFMTGPPPSPASTPRWADSRGMRRLTRAPTGTAPDATRRIASSQSARA